MAIVKRKDSLGRNYYYNTTKKERTTEAAYNKSKSAKSTLSVYAARKGRPSKDYCSTAGANLKKRNSSKAGAILHTCAPPRKKEASRKAMFANIAARKAR
jgi:hypothetical protein